MIVIEIPGLRLVNVANAREHFRARSRRVKGERAAVRMAWLAAGRPTVAPPARVVITRIGPMRMDSDNVVTAGKAVRDELAAIVFGVDDRDRRIEWVVIQESAGRGVYGVRVEIASAEEVAA